MEADYLHIDEGSLLMERTSVGLSLNCLGCASRISSMAALGWEAALAIYAAALSSLLGAVQLIDFVRKRPRLALTLRAELDRQGGRNEARLVLDVANDPHGVLGPS
jgi:hypothetical protein